jgi:uncharacterized membrane protein
MANYLIIGGDGKEYGPVTDADVRKWIGEGRLSAQSQAKSESDAEFRALAQFPEFATALNPLGSLKLAEPPASFADFQERDYDLDLGGCISGGFELIKTNGGLLIGGVLIYGLIQMAFGLFGKIPIIGVIFSIANFVMSGAFIGGLFYLFLRVIRKEPASLGDIFVGFRRSFGQLFLGVLVMGLLVGLTMLPFIIVFCLKLFPLIKGANLETMSQQDSIAFIKQVLTSAIIPSLWVLLLCAIPSTFLSVSWKFTLPLIIDKQLDFAAAMKASWKMVNKHWWHIFGLVVLIDLLNLAGFCLCCVGLIVTVPIGLGVLMIAYETIFGAEKN